MGENWVAKKLDVTLRMPTTLNLESLRGKGLQPGEAGQRVALSFYTVDCHWSQWMEQCHHSTQYLARSCWHCWQFLPK
jgi:hypothetical protein